MVVFEQVYNLVFFAELTIKGTNGCKNATGCKKGHKWPAMERRSALSAALTCLDIWTMAEVCSMLWCGKSQVVLL